MSNTADKPGNPRLVLDTTDGISVPSGDSSTTPTLASSESGSGFNSFSEESAASNLSTLPPKSYLETLFEKSIHSPPKKDGRIPKTEKSEVERRISALRPLWLVTGEVYEKLAWMVGKDLDLAILRSNWGRYPGGVYYLTSQLLSESCAMGQRFHAVFNSDGDELSHEPTESSFLHYTQTLLPVWDGSGQGNSGNVYTIFGDQQHTNVEVFHRFQASGNCFIQAAILIHWYKSIWGREGDASKIYLIHLSKYVRNMFDGRRLFRHIVLDAGGDARDTAETLMPQTRSYREKSFSTEFEKIRALMQDHGPGLVSLYRLNSDIHESDTFSYTGTRPEPEFEDHQEPKGHAMVAVGVRKDAADKVHLLLQNFWKDKEFLEIDYDYLVTSHGSLDFFIFKINPPAQVLDCVTTRSYMQKADQIRVATSSKFLEGPNNVVLQR
jgi:hypothetical protein